MMQLLVQMADNKHRLPEMTLPHRGPPQTGKDSAGCVCGRPGGTPPFSEVLASKRGSRLNVKDAIRDSDSLVDAGRDPGTIKAKRRCLAVITNVPSHPSVSPGGSPTDGHRTRHLQGRERRVTSREGIANIHTRKKSRRHARRQRVDLLIKRHKSHPRSRTRQSRATAVPL